MDKKKYTKMSELSEEEMTLLSREYGFDVNHLFLIAEGLINLKSFDDIEVLKDSIVNKDFHYTDITLISESIKKNKSDLFFDDTLFWAKMLIQNSPRTIALNRLFDRNFLMDEDKILRIFKDIEKLSPNIFSTSQADFAENGKCFYKSPKMRCFELLEDYSYSKYFIETMVSFDDSFLKYKKFEDLTKDEYIKKYSMFLTCSENIPYPKSEWFNDKDFCFKFMQNIYYSYNKTKIPSNVLYDKNIINKVFISCLTNKLYNGYYCSRRDEGCKLLENIKSRKMEKYILKISPLCILEMREDTINNKGLVMSCLKRLSKTIESKKQHKYDKYLIRAFYENLEDLKYDEDIIKLALSLNNSTYVSLPKEIREREDIIDMAGKKYGAYKYFSATINYEKITETDSSFKSNFIIDDSFIRKISYDRLVYSQLDQSMMRGRVEKKTPKELKKLLTYNHKLISFYTVNSALTEDELKNHFLKYPLDLQYFNHNIYHSARKNTIINDLIKNRCFVLECAINNPKVIYYIKDFFEIDNSFVIKLLEANPEAISELKEEILNLNDEEIIQIYKKTKACQLLKYINDEAFERLVLIRKISFKNIKNKKIKKRFKKVLKGLDNDCFVV